ncbi:MAG: cytochrome P450 [Anaerolineae bacterium]|nr:cytochrome P450 [Anaerolineae bacterium]
MSQRRYPPGPKGEILFGSMRPFAQDRLNFLIECREEYGDLVHLRILGRHAYLINDPDLVRFVLVEHPELFHKTPLFKRATRNVIGNGLLTSEGEFHKRQRQLAQPAFHHQRIANYGDEMVDFTRQMLDSWQPGAVLDIHEAMMQLTMQIVARTLFHAEVVEDAHQIGTAITTALRFATQRTARPLSLPDWVPTRTNREVKQQTALLHTTIDRIINEHRTTNADQGDLLSMLMLAEDEHGERMSDQQLRDEAMTIFIAGHETTADALTWTFFLLAQHPEIERKLQDEIALLHGLPPTVNDLAHLPYTEMVIKESMRLYPPAWIVPRLAISDFELGGYPIRHNSIVFTSPYTMHRHPRYFPDPERFLPERWTPEQEKTLPRYAYFPFGGGPRVCIGNGFAMMEARLVLATIVQQVQLRLVAGQQITPEPVITLRPAHEILMQADRQEIPIKPELLVQSE